MKEGVVTDILILCFLILFGFCIYQIGSSERIMDEDWNDGYCTECGEKYRLVGVDHYTKYYVCPNCGKEVER